jgi:hypothetical protein
MVKTLAILAAAAAFLMAVQAVRDHGALIREGYGIGRLLAEKDELSKEAARTRDRVSRLRSPARLAERAKELGLVAEYPEQYAVVHVAPEQERDDAPLVAFGR